MSIIRCMSIKRRMFGVVLSIVTVIYFLAVIINFTVDGDKSAVECMRNNTCTYNHGGK